MIQRSFFWFLTILLFTACSSSKSTTGVTSESSGKWQNEAVVADGKNNEWSGSGLEYDKNTKLAYAVTNDATNIYVLLTTTDQMTQAKILNAGLSLYVDPSGKNKEITSINYPLSAETKMPFNRQATEKQDMQKINADALARANQYTLNGFFTGDGGYSVMQKNNGGVSVKMGYSASKELVYEAIIPFQALSKDKINTGENIAVGFKINGLPKPDMVGGDRPSGGRGTGRGGRAQGGGTRGGGRQGATGGGDMKLFEDTKYWKTFYVAGKQ